jgi:hypothetical protein
MTVIKIKNSNVTGRLPSSGDIEIAELALNIADKKLYSKDAAGAIFEIGVAGDLPSGPNPPNSGNNIGDLFFDTTEGNLVYWDGSAWIPLPGDPEGNGFVKVDGDNMTGDLTLGTDKITLDAKDGSITAASKITAVDTIKTRQDSSSAIAFGVTQNGVANGDSTFRVDGSGKLRIGADATNSPTITLAADGSIDAAADVNTAGKLVSDRTSGSQANFQGKLNGSLTANLNSSGDWFLGGTANSVDPNIALLGSNGSAKYKGGVLTTATTHGYEVRSAIGSQQSSFYSNLESGAADNAYHFYGGGTGASEIRLQANGSGFFSGNFGVGNNAATPNALINSDGTASFEGGEITIGAVPGITGPGGVVATNFIGDQAVGDDPVFIGRENGVDTLLIKGDGSAEFASYVLSGNVNGANTAISGETGEVAHYDGSLYQWRLYGNGSAIFSGDVQAAYYTAIQDSANSAVFRGTYTGSSLTYSSVIYGDGSAVFGSGVLCNSSSVTGMIAGNFNGNDANMAYPCIRARQYAAGGRAYQGMNAAGTETYYVGGSGEAGFAGTVTATVVPPSDARFKENITPAKPQLADVVALGGLLKNYDWNDQAPLSEEIRAQRQLGLIAQEAAEVCPAIVKDIHRTKQGAVITPEEIIPAVYEDKVIPAEYKTIVVPAKLGPKGKEIVPASTEEVLVTPEYTEQVLVEEEKVIPATYETLDDSYKGISTDALIMKLIGAVTELTAEVTALKAAKLTKK